MILFYRIPEQFLVQVKISFISNFAIPDMLLLPIFIALWCYNIMTNIIRGGSSLAATSKMERFVIIVNYHKALRLGFCFSPRSTSDYFFLCVLFCFFFLFLIKQLFFSHETVKVSKLLCLLCFLSWNCKVIIYNLIVFV